MQSRPERLYRRWPQQKDGEMNQVEKAARFSELHVKGAPLLLYNAWDAGTAKSILDTGAKAIATSTPGGSQPFVKQRKRRASTSLSMRGQICFSVNNATRLTLLTTLWTARKPMPPQERPASSFRA